MHDIVIRGGTIVDGTGAPCHTGDVAIDGGALTQVGGRVEGKGRRELDHRRVDPWRQGLLVAG